MPSGGVRLQSVRNDLELLQGHKAGANFAPSDGRVVVVSRGHLILVAVMKGKSQRLSWIGAGDIGGRAPLHRFGQAEANLTLKL